jgi:hypothetical protein
VVAMCKLVTNLEVVIGNGICVYFFLFLSVLYGATYEVLGLSLQCTHDSGFIEGFIVKNKI